MALTRPKGINRYQDISAALAGLPSSEMDNELNNIIAYLNALGVIQSNVLEWAIDAGVPTFVSATQFTLPGDQTTVYTPQRKVKAMLGATAVYSPVDTSSYDVGLTKTTVTLVDAVLTAGLTQILYGMLNATVSELSVPETIQRRPIRSTAIAYTFTKHDFCILVDATSGPLVITLPLLSAIASATKSRELVVIKTDSSVNAVTITATAPDAINGAASRVISRQFEGAYLFGYSGGEWKEMYVSPQPGTARINYGTVEPTIKEDGRVWYDSTNKELKRADAGAFAAMVLGASSFLAGAVLRYAQATRSSFPMVATWQEIQFIDFTPALADSIVVVLAMATGDIDTYGGISWTTHQYKLYLDSVAQDDTLKEFSGANYSFSGAAVRCPSNSFMLMKLFPGLTAVSHKFALHGYVSYQGGYPGVCKSIQLFVFEMKKPGT